MTRLPHRQAATLATLASVLPLATAFGFEWWGGLVPCALCLLERWPWRFAIAFGLFAILLPARLGRVALVLMLLAGLGAVATAGTHVGVEFGWWPSPLPECAAPHFAQGSIAERLHSMPAKPSKSCEDPVYAFDWLPVSFAQLGLIYALAFSSGMVGLLTLHGANRR